MGEHFISLLKRRAFMLQLYCKKAYTGYEDYNILPAGTTYALAG